jgi:hypothetical protein
MVLGCCSRPSLHISRRYESCDVRAARVTPVAPAAHAVGIEAPRASLPAPASGAPAAPSSISGRTTTCGLRSQRPRGFAGLAGVGASTRTIRAVRRRRRMGARAGGAGSRVRHGPKRESCTFGGSVCTWQGICCHLDSGGPERCVGLIRAVCLGLSLKNTSATRATQIENNAGHPAH